MQMHQLLERSLEDERFNHHIGEYSELWQRAGQPPPIVLQELFAEALAESKQDTAEAFPELYQFFRRQLGKNLPLNWFGGLDAIYAIFWFQIRAAIWNKALKQKLSA